MIVRDTRVRRLFDVVVAAATLAVTGPVLGLVTVSLKLVSQTPVFTGEERVCPTGVFRRSRLRTSGSGRFLEHLGIAALPGLVNVLRGQMSIVGPNPVAPDEAAWFTPSEARLLTVRPGLISPAWRARSPAAHSASDRRPDNRESVAESRMVELRYIQRRTAATDTWIIARATTRVCLAMLASVLRVAWRALPWVISDTVIAAASFLIAYFLRFLDATQPYGPANDGTMVRAVAVASIGFALVNLSFRLHRRAWRYAAGVEVLPIALSVLTSSVAAVTLDVLHPGIAARPIPLSVLAVGSLFAAVGFSVFRYRSRVAPAIASMARPVSGPSPQPTRTIVYGAGELGQLLVRRLRTHADGRRYKVIAFLDDDPRKRGLTVHGIKVIGGRNVMRSLVARERIEVIVLAMGSTTGSDMRDILAIAQATDAQIKVAHDIVNWIGDRYSAALLRDMRPEDLIGRQVASLDHERCRDLVSGRTVLVTGACGSIGSELIRQILVLEPARIVAVDINESGLYDLGVEAKALGAGVELCTVVGDVTNRARMLELVRSENPEIIFHVAAYKHVPLMELYPQEAAWTNVWGTWVMADVAIQNGSRHFVFVSTDKAVNPSSIMGATKRMAEILVHRSRDGASNGRGPSHLRMTVVRFGNVLGTRGSVIPTFQRQIELGGPVTITHADMTRYFMHTPEAAALIVEAGSLSSSDEAFMLDMGDRIRIEDLALKMIRLRGLRPGVDIAIEYTGLRPGEKLHEELTYSYEQRVDTPHPRVFKIISQGKNPIVESRIEMAVGEFIAGILDREAFSAELVAIASELVDDSQAVAGPSRAAGRALIGRRASPPVREATAPG